MRSSSKFWRILGMCAFLAVNAGGQALQAETLRFGLKTEPTSLDPHFHVLTPNIQFAHHIFGHLVDRDANLNYVPNLAESWKTLSDTEWEFKLRKNVKFSDGSDFTAQDVVFSMRRAPVIPNSPSSFKNYISNIKEIKVIDPYTVRFVTEKPMPTMLFDLSYISILSHKVADPAKGELGITSQDLNSGKGLIGTGPYQFVSWKRGSEFVLEKNPHYWGKAPRWDKVQMKVLANASTRLNALRSGSVDLIEALPTEDIANLRKNAQFSVFETPTVRVIFVGLMQGKEMPPGLTGTDGKNPFTDIRVRQAMSMAVDRKALVEQIMANSATLAGDIMPAPVTGHRPTPVYPEYNVEKAKQLMAEAGYANGFGMEFLAPSGRYINDADVAQALATFWGKIGVKVKVNAQVPSLFFTNASDGKFTAYMIGWGDTDITKRQIALFHTRDAKAAAGHANYHGYSSPKVDALVAEANRTLDEKKRLEMQYQATTEIMEKDFGIMPLFFENIAWATRKGLTLQPRADQYLYAQDVQ